MSQDIVTEVKSAVEMSEGRGARVRRLFPTRGFSSFDPFVLFDEFYVEKPAGFPTHQHSGFEFITYMIEGVIVHEDSMDNRAEIPVGGIQHAITGNGIRHSEMPGMDGINHGIFIQLPLEKSLNKSRIFSMLKPSKDIDCMAPNSLGRLLIGKEIYSPANVEAIFQILRHYNINMNRQWGIIGIDNILGRPLISKLCSMGLRFSTFKPSDNLSVSKIIVSDIQEMSSIGKKQVTKDSIIIDNGNNYQKGKVYGDFDYKNVKEIVHAITPVPGGIGPVTVAMLLSNLIKATIKKVEKTIL